MGTIFEPRTHPFNINELLLRRSELNKAIVVNDDSDAAETTDLLIKAGTLAAYAIFDVCSSGLGTVKIYEGGNVTTSGATIVPYINMNRNQSTESLETVAYSSPTVTSVTAAATIAIAPTNASTVRETVILKPNTKYLVRHTSAAANTVVGLTAIIAE